VPGNRNESVSSRVIRKPLPLERWKASVESSREKLKALIESYLQEYGCPIAYAEEIADGILDNFAVSFKPSAGAPENPDASSRGKRMESQPAHKNLPFPGK